MKSGHLMYRCSWWCKWKLIACWWRIVPKIADWVTFANNFIKKIMWGSPPGAWKWNPFGIQLIISSLWGLGVPLASSSITCPIKQRHCCNRHGWTLCVADVIVVFKLGFKSLATILGFEACQTFEPTITNLRVKFVSWCKGIFSAVTFEPMVRFGPNFVRDNIFQLHGHLNCKF